MPATAGVQLARDVAARAQHARRFLLGSVAVVLALQWVPRGLEFTAPALWLLQFVLIARLDLHNQGQLVRAMTSLLFGFALAWLAFAALPLAWLCGMGRAMYWWG